MEYLYVVGFIMSFLLAFVTMPKVIAFLHKIKFSQSEREEGLASHQVKTGTPTMGGIVFLVVPLLVCGLLNPHMFGDVHSLLVIFAFVGYGLIGFIDDFIIVVKKHNDGLSAKVKFFLQSFLAILFFFVYMQFADTSLWIPIADVEIAIGPLYFFVVFIMFTGESNAVNLTDGLDGLCAGTMLIALVPFIAFSFHEGQENITLLLLTISGSLLSYLWFNKHPARIFMGDTGSLALGGLLAAVAMVLHKELLLLVIGGLFLVETISVALQVMSYKTRKKRIFKMAPIHHHFEMCGMSETQVVFMFYGIGIICAVLGYILGVM
ncbi:MAG: phospho-N-acetylmuramoyl-pentapeptide-transferase [Breznakia sp.]